MPHREPAAGRGPVPAGSRGLRAPAGLLVATLAAGCATLSPRLPSTLGPSPDAPSSATVSGVTVSVTRPDPRGPGVEAGGRWVPLRVEVRNGAGDPLPLRPGHFRLRAADGGAEGPWPAVPLDSMAGTRIEAAGPGRYAATDELEGVEAEEARRRGGADGLDPVSAAFHARGGPSHFRVVRLPTAGMREAALPEGPVEAGAAVAGLLHFPRRALAGAGDGKPDGTSLVLVVELASPDGERPETLEIPVTAILPADTVPGPG